MAEIKERKRGMKNVKAPTTLRDHAEYFASGGLAGIFSVVVGHPLDTVKVRLQTLPTPCPWEKPRYRGTMDFAFKTIKKEGAKSLWKGMATPITLFTPIFSLWFLGYEWGKELQQKNPKQQLTYLQLFNAGAFASMISIPAQVPGERVKCMLQAPQPSKGPKAFPGPKAVIKVLYRQGGIRNFYVGTLATTLREVPSTGVFFATYEALQDIMDPGRQGKSFFHTVLAGGLAGVTNWMVALPADVLKTRQQTAPVGEYPRLRDIYKQLVKEDGFLRLYRGMIHALVRAFPTNAACFVRFEWSMQFFNWLRLYT